MNWIKKLIPAYLEIRSLYWVEYDRKMEDNLEAIFNRIDNEDYAEANRLIIEFESNFSQSGVPLWIASKYARIYNAKTMVAFLQSPE